MRATWTGLMMAAVLAGPATRGQDPPPVTQKDLQVSANNLKQIGLAIIVHADENGGRMPADITGKDGNPLLSWRVAILPHVGEEKLFKQFKLDEPWDSETNKALVEKMPQVFAPVRVKAKAGETFYQAFAGPKTLFDPKTPARYPASIRDGTSNTGLVFEAGEAVVWTKPADLPFDEQKALPKLGGLFDGECTVVLCDGSVKRLKKGADEAELKKLITPSGGEIIDFKKIEK